MYIFKYHFTNNFMLGPGERGFFLQKRVLNFQKQCIRICGWISKPLEIQSVFCPVFYLLSTDIIKNLKKFF